MLPQSVDGRSGKAEIKVYGTSSIWNFMYGVYYIVVYDVMQIGTYYYYSCVEVARTYTVSHYNHY